MSSLLVKQNAEHSSATSGCVLSSPPEMEHKPFTNEDSCVQVRFDPHVKNTRRRKSSLTHQGAEEGTGSAFLHKMLGLEEMEEEDEEGPGKAMHRKMDGMQSMTRSQLHDMVLGLREMGRKYANIHLHVKVREVFIVTKPWDKSLVVQTKILAKWLLENGYNVYVYVQKDFETNPGFMGVEKEAALDIKADQPGGKLGYWTPEMCATRPGGFDFVLTLGGDGTVLYASWLFQKVVPPVLSFALGSLGFLTKFNFDDHPKTLSRIFGEDGVTVSLRVRFEGSIMRSIPRPDGQSDAERSLHDELVNPDQDVDTHHPDGTCTVLNEVVVDRGPNPTMSTVELYANDEFLTPVAADGVCIATPTGSTAYSLAAGGSLCHPALPGMLVSVICAHSLTFRPLILPDSMVLRVGVPYNARNSAWVSFDGKKRTELRQGDYVTVVTSQYPLPTVQYRMDNKDWFDSIRRTMNWGDRVQQKAVN